jgi:biopolymer transport protein ExbB
MLRRLLLVLVFFPSLALAQSPATTEPAAPVITAPAETQPAPTTAPSDPAAPAPVPAVSPPAETPAAAAPAQAVLPKDLSVWGMFMAADWVVQGVMIGLVLSSVLTWTVFVAKSLELAMAVRRQRRLLAAVDSAASLDKAPASDLVAAAQAEQRLSADTGTGVLATIGSTAPFVGLFGTVWGIMNSFIGISESRPPTSPWSRRASPRRCWPPPSASSRPSRRW